MRKWSSVMMLTLGLMTLGEFKAYPYRERILLVLGALNLTNAMDIVCPVPVTVGELEAALRTRQFNDATAWVELMTGLMDERGCGAKPVKPDA